MAESKDVPSSGAAKKPPSASKSAAKRTPVKSSSQIAKKHMSGKPGMVKPMKPIVSKPKIMKNHTVKDDDTLSGIALKYYGHATKPYYMHIYNHNKAAIGDNPNVVRPGTELEIPELTGDLKD